MVSSGAGFRPGVDRVTQHGPGGFIGEVAAAGQVAQRMVGLLAQRQGRIPHAAQRGLDCSLPADSQAPPRPTRASRPTVLPAMVSSSSTSACIAGGMPPMAASIRGSRAAIACWRARPSAGSKPASTAGARPQQGAPGVGELAVAPGRLHQGQAGAGQGEHHAACQPDLQERTSAHAGQCCIIGHARRRGARLTFCQPAA
jgi:hypothetical protein